VSGDVYNVAVPVVDLITAESEAEAVATLECPGWGWGPTLAHPGLTTNSQRTVQIRLPCSTTTQWLTQSLPTP
jgi:hypothetical protein